jgi:hypothetical protein
MCSIKYQATARIGHKDCMGMNEGYTITGDIVMSSNHVTVPSYTKRQEYKAPEEHPVLVGRRSRYIKIVITIISYLLCNY